MVASALFFYYYSRNIQVFKLNLLFTSDFDNIVMLIGTSQAQNSFIKQSILHNIRVDGRKNWMRRNAIIKTGVLPHLPGSSYVYIEHEDIQIYTGIKVKVQKVEKVSEKIKPIYLEINSMRKGGDEENQQLGRLQNLLQMHFINKLVQYEEISKYLRIDEAKKHELSLFIDVFLLSSPYIDQLQIVEMAIKAALNSTSISEISVAYNEVTDEETIEITQNLIPLQINKWQQILIVGIVDKKQFVTGLRKQEYQAMDTCLLITISNDKVVQIQSLKGTVTPDILNKAARFALSVHQKYKKNE